MMLSFAKPEFYLKEIVEFECTVCFPVVVKPLQLNNQRLRQSSENKRQIIKKNLSNTV